WWSRHSGIRLTCRKRSIASIVVRDACCSRPLMYEQIEDFFQRYARAVDAMRIDELASLHHTPCLKVHGDGTVQLLSDRDAVCGFFRELAGKYAARGH